jgi:hydrogenase expression/formation protein HypE
MNFVCPVPSEAYETVTLAHGGGGKVTHRLIQSLLVPAFDNPALAALHDGAVLPWDGEQLAFTTDSYVVRPRFFPGGNIGNLAVHGTVNDLAMCGARPVALSLAFILEEGLPIAELRTIVESVRDACALLDVPVVTGDTKVVERGHGDGVFINTSGVGVVARNLEIAPQRVRPGDVVILSGPIAEHGVAILSVREGLEFETRIESDTAPLWPVVERVLAAGGWDVHALRDATRGGVASALNEIAEASSTGIVLDGAAIPVKDEVRGACELLGLDPLYIANEGRFVAFVAPERAGRVLAAMRSEPVAREARVVGRVVNEHPGTVRMNLAFGGSRVVDMLSGEQLPRIC